jgi:hypothetical protein
MLVGVGNARVKAACSARGEAPEETNESTNQRPGAPQAWGVVSVPGDQLDSLTRRVRLNGAEWRITLAILVSPVPISARSLATHLKLDTAS